MSGFRPSFSPAARKARTPTTCRVRPDLGHKYVTARGDAALEVCVYCDDRRYARDARDRRPKTCCSAAHETPKQCWGYVRRCPLCSTSVCYEDGAADDIDATMPGICDTCAQGAEPYTTSPVNGA